jgi:hypothetical protein
LLVVVGQRVELGRHASVYQDKFRNEPVSAHLKFSFRRSLPHESERTGTGCYLIDEE